MKDLKKQLEKRAPEMLNLILRSKNCVVASIDEEGYPNERMMFSIANEGVRTHYFSTNVSSHHTPQFLANKKACVYFFDARHYKGLTLIGDIEVCTDHETKASIWKPTDIMYYPKGVDDEDYCVLKFTVTHGRYYYGMGSVSFTIDELEEPLSDEQKHINKFKQ